MNSKIKNYVEVLFQDIPNSKKARELKEEILSNMNEHFESHIAEGQSENQAYTSAIADLGDVDELLAEIVPEKELKEKIDLYKEKKAKMTSIALTFFFTGIILLVSLYCIANMTSISFNIGLSETLTIVGLVIFLVCCAATIIVSINITMRIPDDVKPYLSKKSGDKGPKLWTAVSSVYWLIVTTIYFLVSFLTGAWHITWLIWLAAPALSSGLNIYFFGKDDD